MTDALGNPTDLMLTPGQAHDLNGADGLLPNLRAQALLADKAYGADERVILPLKEAGIAVVIPPKSNHKIKRVSQGDFCKKATKLRDFGMG